MVLLVAWRAYQVRSGLDAARDDASDLRRALSEDDPAGVTAARERLLEHASSAGSAVSGPVWSTLSRLPLVGDDARAVRTIARAADDLAASALPSVTEVAQQRDRLVPRGGRLDLAAIAELRDPVDAAAQATSRARFRVQRIDADGLLGPVASGVRDAVAEIADLDDAMRASRLAVRLLPPMLGAEGDRRYLLVVQNSGEARATGGLGGAVVELDARGGKISLKRQVPGNTLVFPRPVLPETAQETAIFGPTLTSDFRDANSTPDLPRAAEIWRALWRERYAGRVDGVVTMDAVVLADLLRVTGPVTVEGVRVTGDDAVRLLLADTYRRFADPDRQDAFFQGVASTVFERVTQGTDDAGGLLGVLARGVDQRRLFVYSADAAQQRLLAPTRIAGALPRRPGPVPQVGLYLNDGSASKVAYYLRSQVRVAGTECVGNHQVLRLAARLTSTLTPQQARTLPDYPAGSFARRGLTRGTYVLNVLAYGPVGGSIDALTVDGRDIQPVTTLPDGDRPTATSALTLAPGESVDLEWTMTTGANQRLAPELQVTPGASPLDAIAGDSAC